MGHMINPPRIAPPATSSVRLLNRATIAAAVLAFTIFVIDIRMPLSADVGVLYVIPLLVGALSGPPRFLRVAAGVSSTLTVTGA